MFSNSKDKKTTHFGLAGLIITLGIVYGDLGTSPLYTMSAIMSHSRDYGELFILGALSCIFWTLTLQTTLKYIIITLRANNNGEGGIFLLLTLLKERKRWLYVVAVIGACALIGDGIITPAVTVTSAIEGLLVYFPQMNVSLIVVIILSLLFLFQQYGTASLGRYFGPIMCLWFLMMAILGVRGLVHAPWIIKAANPYYAFHLLTNHPHFLGLLGAVFLCTTGAEALYSDLGHCGLKNIRVSWGYVKVCLLTSYFGQGAWILSHPDIQWAGLNPFFEIMPSWFLPIGICMATLAAIIASQALISGSFTIVSEAISLRLFPNIKVHYPTTEKGQMYVPLMNKILWIGCIGVVLYFRRSLAMESAYGLSITLAMLMTSILLTYYLAKKHSVRIAVLCGSIFFTIESLFFVANITKFMEGGWVSILICLFFVGIMYIWQSGAKTVTSNTNFVDLAPYKPMLQDISKDTTIPLYASHLVFMTRSNNINQIEHQILYSIFRNRPKRADHYWLVKMKICDDPYQFEYKLTEIIPGKMFRIEMYLGFKEQPRVNLYFQQILIELHEKGVLSLESRYDSLGKHHIMSDFRYIVIEQLPNHDYELTRSTRWVLNSFFWMKQHVVNPIKSYGLDPTRTKIESIPLMGGSELFYEQMIAQFKQKHRRTISRRDCV